MPASDQRRLPPEALLKKCDLSTLSLGDETSSIDSKMFLGFGQERFCNALELFVETDDPHHNLHVTDLSGSGGFSVLEEYLKKTLEGRVHPDPQDICYVHNFDDPHRPLPLMFPKGMARKFQRRLAHLLAELKKAVPHALNSQQTGEAVLEARAEYETWKKEMEDRIRTFVREYGFAMNGSLEAEMAFQPLISLLREISPEIEGEDRQVTQEEMRALNESEKALIKEKNDALHTALHRWFAEIDFQRECLQRTMGLKNAMESIRHHAAKQAIEEVFNTIFPDEGPRHFRAGLLGYAISRYDIFLIDETAQQQTGPWAGTPENHFLPWDVRVFVDHSETEDVPIVAGRITALGKAIGSITRGRSYGPFNYTVDHRNLLPGFFHVANGGYLILSARDVVSVPGLWQVLKYILKNQEIPVGETPFTPPGYETLRAEPIPANLKVIVFGPAWLMHVFSRADDEFSRLFKIRGELLTKVKRTDEQIHAYRAWLNAFTEEEALHSLTDDATSALIEHAGRLAGDHEHLSIDLEALATVVREANTLVDKRAPEAQKRIGRAHITEAARRRFWRSGASHERQLEYVRSRILLIATEGSVVGQINALAVGQLADTKHEIEAFCRSAPEPFALSSEEIEAIQVQCADDHDAAASDLAVGKTMRITAQASVGRFAITNIQKEVKLAGPSFQKADLIVQGLLRGLYAKDAPLETHITYSFEQMSGGIDGDSASLAKFYVITSAIADIPLAQGIAITGSVNQHGDVQPIGGVNEKIEGFFDICSANGELTGSQGVIIPHQNACNLMLREDVVQAVAEQKFNVWAIHTLDEGIEILFNTEPDRFHEKVKSQLEELAKKSRRFYAPSSGDA